jgi:hypothetical protein
MTGGNDTNLAVSLCVGNDENRKIGQLTSGQKANLAIILPVIDLSQYWPLPDQGGLLETNSMLAMIDVVAFMERCVKELLNRCI